MMLCWVIKISGGVIEVHSCSIKSQFEDVIEITHCWLYEVFCNLPTRYWAVACIVLPDIQRCASLQARISVY